MIAEELRYKPDSARHDLNLPNGSILGYKEVDGIDSQFRVVCFPFLRLNHWVLIKLIYENNIITAVRIFWNSYFISMASIFPVSTIPVSGYSDFSAPREGWASQINLGKCENVKNSWLFFG